MAKHMYATQKWWQKLLAGQGLLGTETPIDYIYEGITTGNWNPFERASESDLYGRIIDDLESQGYDFSNFSQTELETLLGNDLYWDDKSNLLFDKHTFKTDAFISDYNQMQEAMSRYPTLPVYQDYLNEAREDYDKIAKARIAELEAEREARTAMYADELNNLASSYNISRAGVLSSQYQQNAQLMENYTSQMDRSRRNALEAGASAGIRIANDVNTLLSVQNKQSQTSLDTANQLAQMMVSQRNAEASARNNYNDYMSQNRREQWDAQDSVEANALNYANTNFNAAQSSYAELDKRWKSQYGNNPFSDYAYSYDPYKNSTNGGKYGV